MDASTVDEDVDGVAEAAFRLGGSNLLGQALDLLVVGQISHDNLDVATELLDEVVGLEVLLTPLSTGSGARLASAGEQSQNQRYTPEPGERRRQPWRERAPSSGH